MTLKPFTAEGRFECGLDAAVAGKVWAFVAVLDDRAGAALGVAMANEPGYTPVPLTWCHADSYHEMEAHAEALNLAEGVDPREAAKIICSTMRAQDEDRP